MADIVKVPQGEGALKKGFVGLLSKVEAMKKRIAKGDQRTMDRYVVPMATTAEAVAAAYGTGLVEGRTMDKPAKLGPVSVTTIVGTLTKLAGFGAAAAGLDTAAPHVHAVGTGILSGKAALAGFNKGFEWRNAALEKAKATGAPAFPVKAG